jgi:hypothetical protein
VSVGVASAVGSDARRRDDGDALRIAEERERCRLPHAAATPWGGWPFARDDFRTHDDFHIRSRFRRGLQKASRDARIHFSAAC